MSTISATRLSLLALAVLVSYDLNVTLPVCASSAVVMGVEGGNVVLRPGGTTVVCVNLAVEEWVEEVIVGWPRKFRETKFRGISRYFYFVFSRKFWENFRGISRNFVPRKCSYFVIFHGIPLIWFKENLSQYGGKKVVGASPPCRS